MSISENNGWVDDNGTKRRVNAIEKYSYLIGQKINKWSVIDIRNDRRHPDAICVCECGTTKRVGVRNLINDASKDCGCGRKKMLRDTRTKNLVGKKFGMLTVVEMLEESDKFKRRMYIRIPYWECKDIETIIDNCLQRLNERGVKESA